MAYQQNWLRNAAAESFGFYPKAGGKGYSLLGMADNAAMRGAGGAAKFLGRMAMRSLPVAGTVFLMSQGFKESGAMGIVGGAAESIAFTAAYPVLLNPITIGAALIGGSTYVAMKAGKAHMRGLRNVEMGNVGLGAIGTQQAATMRQRAAGALKNTHINGRMALGNEAMLFHTNY